MGADLRAPFYWSSYIMHRGSIASSKLSIRLKQTWTAKIRKGKRNLSLGQGHKGHDVKTYVSCLDVAWIAMATEGSWQENHPGSCRSLWRWNPSTQGQFDGLHLERWLFDLVSISSQSRKLQIFFSPKPRGFSLENSTSKLTNKTNSPKPR